jgi:membrane associated rhomboid family serine protease
MLIVPTEKRFDWKHAPIMLILIVLINVLVFLVYQSNDSQKIFEAMEPFVESGYVEKEWPIYESYLEKEKRADELRDARRYQRQEDYWTLSQFMLMDSGYFLHVSRAARSEFSIDEYQQWKGPRAEIQDTFNSISTLAFGLKSTDVTPVNLLTHQFLHGGMGHIVGNMIFLIVFGFAVEAAIGHFRFLIFYLIGGVFAGLAQVATTLGSDVPLVGASGAISGVMAMYLAVFRLKRIEFFYWVFFFVGYFRAPALLILPFYIGKEIYQYYAFEGSNVAFMAHAGGFVAGGILIGIALLLNRKVLNDDYIEQDQVISVREKGLAEIYQSVESLRFDYALKLTGQLIQKEGVDFQLAQLRYNLEKVKKGKGLIPAFRSLMTLKNVSVVEMEALNRMWIAEKAASKLLPNDDQLKLAFQFTSLKDLTGAEHILDNLHKQRHHIPDLILLANKLATRFSEKHDHGRSMKYQELGQTLSKEGHHGVV